MKFQMLTESKILKKDLVSCLKHTAVFILKFHNCWALKKYYSLRLKILTTYTSPVAVDSEFYKFFSLQLEKTSF